jgi:hypothetical protein
MKRILALFSLVFILTACDTWGQPPQPFPVWTPLPSQTPQVVSPTPFILLPPSDINTPVIILITPVTPTNTEIPSPTNTPEPPTATLTFTPVPVQSVDLEILGCNTSFDLLLGMGEVTNAYVNVKNTGNVSLPNTCALLRAIDEDREHPDKKRCVDNLPVGHQVRLKLTADTQYKVDTIIQVDVSSNETILLRLDRQSCRNISLFGGVPSDVGVVKPIQP